MNNIEFNYFIRLCVFDLIAVTKIHMGLVCHKSYLHGDENVYIKNMKTALKTMLKNV